MIIESLSYLSEILQKATSSQSKLALLNAVPSVREYLEKHPYLGAILNDFPIEGEAVCKQLIAIGQLDRFMDFASMKTTSFRDFVYQLIEVDRFYRELGGIVGYQKKILELLQSNGGVAHQEISQFRAPTFIDITEATEEVLEAIEWGIRSLPLMVEMYPMGGAADRLHLVDETTGQELPAVKLGYAGRPLFEGL
ncbi:MAG: hypothetical protein FJZ64_02005, partial [Chlamydiae bacterium]|nr:hypothetical protein [Chlamydiota bacterium]